MSRRFKWLKQMELSREITARRNSFQTRQQLLVAVSTVVQMLLLDGEAPAFKNFLRKLGMATHSKRAYIYQNRTSEDDTIAIQRFDWNETEEAHRSFLLPPHLSYRKHGLEDWYDKLSYNAFDSNQREIRHQVPAAQHTISFEVDSFSILLLPVFVGHYFWGFVGFERDHTKIWTNDERAILITAANYMGIAIHRSIMDIHIYDPIYESERTAEETDRSKFFKLVRKAEGEIQLIHLNGETLLERYGADKQLTNLDILFSRLDHLIGNKQVESYYHQAFRGQYVQFELELFERVFSISLRPLFETEKVTEVIGHVYDLTQHYQEKTKVDFLSSHDALTGLPNRKKLESELRRWIDDMSEEQALCLMCIDLDRFKLINNTAGHRIGDQLLKQVTERLQQCFGDDSLVARQGGDEFSVAFRFTDKKTVEQLAARLQRLIAQPYRVLGQEYMLTSSVGISLYPLDAKNSDQLVKHADSAMHLAKENGDRFVYYHPEMNVVLHKKVEMEKGLRKALENREFMLHYQPKIDLVTGEMVGIEALVRWLHPQKGLMSPGEFIPIAEESSSIVQLGEWVLRTACHQNRRWQLAGFPALPIAVNISARQFQQHDFADVVLHILEESGLAPHYLELEMTESIFQNAASVISRINVLKQSGVQLSIDDFGTGYSSLSYLKRFPVDALKIDQAFVQGINRDDKGAAIVKAIIELGHSMNIKVIAEGVETNEQKFFLIDQRCHTGQGYLFSPPLEAEDFECLWREMQSHSQNRRSF